MYNFHFVEWKSNPQSITFIVTLFCPYNNSRIIEHIKIHKEASSGAAAQSVTVKSTGCGVRSPVEEMKYLCTYYIFISSLSCRGKARRLVSPLNTQCVKKLAKSGEWR